MKVRICQLEKDCTKAQKVVDMLDPIIPEFYCFGTILVSSIIDWQIVDGNGVFNGCQRLS